MGRLRKFLRLKSWEKGQLLQAFFLLPLFIVALRCLGLKRCQTTLTGFGTARTPASLQNPLQMMRRARACSRIVRAAAKHGCPGATCLPQSLTHWWILRRQGISSELRIGVRKENNVFEAHAWVECRGTVLNDPGEMSQRYIPFNEAILTSKKKS